MRNKLTDAACRNAKAKAKPCRLNDGGGLYLRVSTTDGEVVAVSLPAQREGIDRHPREVPRHHVDRGPCRGGGRSRDRATAWLRALLLTGPVRQSDLLKVANADGLAWRTVRRAKVLLGAVAKKRERVGVGTSGSRRPT